MAGIARPQLIQVRTYQLLTSANQIVTTFQTIGTSLTKLHLSK